MTLLPISPRACMQMRAARSEVGTAATWRFQTLAPARLWKMMHLKPRMRLGLIEESSSFLGTSPPRQRAAHVDASDW